MGDSVSRHRLVPLALAAAAGVAVAYAVILGYMALGHHWIVDGQGRPLPVDFLSFWSAGRLALAGHAASAYDWPTMHALHRRIMGHDFSGYYGWGYPPLFFCAAMALALLPYAASFLCWLAVTLALYVAAVVKITRVRSAALLACAAPAVLGNALVGQNGFLSAALIGGALILLEENPLLSGVLLGLLTYKPHLGILFPLALAFGGYWRALIAAALCTAAILVASLVLSPGALSAFVHHMQGMSTTFLSEGSAGWYKIQSLYGLARMLGLGESAGYAAQGILFLPLAAGLAWLWRGPASLALKCAALATGVLLATPYLYMYDFPILSAALAFLYRDRAFDGFEMGGILAANLAVAAFVFFAAPLGLAASLITAALVVRRIPAIQHA